MHIGIISFCDRVAYNIKSSDVKSMILQELESKYKIRIIQRHYHKLTDDSVKHITATPHMVSIRTNGNPYFIYFTMYEDKEIIYFIDKKVHPTYQLPRIIIGRGLYNKSLFKNTLIDGEMIKTKNDKWIFLISDIISYEGRYLQDVHLTDRLKLIYEFLDSKYKQDDTMDMYDYYVKPYYNLSKESIDKIISKEYPFSIRGIYFWASNLKYKPKLENLDDSVIKDVIIKTKESPEFLLKTPILQKNLNLMKTDIPDIYKIYDDKQTYIGIACIQTMQTSLKIRNIFKDTSANTMKQFRCNYDEKWKKWMPLDLVK